MTIERILVPIDFGLPSSAALDYARGLAAVTDATLYLLHVVDDVAARHAEYAAGALTDVHASIEASARQRLNDLAHREKLPASCTAVVASTSPAHAIVGYANVQKVDLIVMGTHGRSPVARMFLGSVADRVLRTATCPVLTVRQATGESLGEDVRTQSTVGTTTRTPAGLP